MPLIALLVTSFCYTAFGSKKNGVGEIHLAVFQSIAHMVLVSDFCELCDYEHEQLSGVSWPKECR
jgi:hypothetical protein